MEADSAGALETCQPIGPLLQPLLAPHGQLPHVHATWLLCLPSSPLWRQPTLQKARALVPEFPDQHHRLAPLPVGSPCPRGPGALHPVRGSRGKPCKAGGCPSHGLRVPTSTSSEGEGGAGSGLQEVASLRRSTPLFITLSSLGCGVARRCRPCSGHRGEGRWGRGQAGAGRREPPGTPPRHTRFSAAASSGSSSPAGASRNWMTLTRLSGASPQLSEGLLCSSGSSVEARVRG